MSTNHISSSAYADHLRGCADLAKEIATRMDIRDDAARQAMLATLIISADRHNLFLEPTPNHTKASVKAEVNKLRTDTDPKFAPELHAIADSLDAIVDATKDEAAARKADAQITDVPRTSTAEDDAGARRMALLAGINSARDLLIKEGHVPLFTPKYMNEFIKNTMQVSGNLGSLDVDQLEELIQLLNTTLDNLKHNKKALDEAPF